LRQRAVGHGDDRNSRREGRWRGFIITPISPEGREGVDDRDDCTALSEAAPLRWRRVERQLRQTSRGRLMISTGESAPAGRNPKTAP
jgi:hypothetical protein